VLVASMAAAHVLGSKGSGSLSGRLISSVDAIPHILWHYTVVRFWSSIDSIFLPGRVLDSFLVVLVWSDLHELCYQHLLSAAHVERGLEAFTASISQFLFFFFFSSLGTSSLFNLQEP
jgi:hypothetical protein